MDLQQIRLQVRVQRDTDVPVSIRIHGNIDEPRDVFSARPLLSRLDCVLQDEFFAADGSRGVPQLQVKSVGFNAGQFGEFFHPDLAFAKRFGIGIHHRAHVKHKLQLSRSEAVASFDQLILLPDVSVLARLQHPH